MLDDIRTLRDGRAVPKGPATSPASGLKVRDIPIEKPKHRPASLRRHRFGSQKLSLHGSLFMGSERGGKSAAVAYGPIETAKLDGGVPQDRLTHVPGRIADRTINRIDEPLPRHYPRASA